MQTADVKGFNGLDVEAMQNPIFRPVHMTETQMS